MPKVRPKTPNIGHVNTRRMSIADLTPADYNPRVITSKAKDGLQNSIDTFGLVQPIIYNEQTGNVVGGHQRLSILRERGATDTDVIVIDISLDKEKALNVTLNNANITGNFTEGLQELLGEIDDDVKSSLLMEELVMNDIDENFSFNDDDDDDVDDTLQGRKPGETFVAQIYFETEDECKRFMRYLQVNDSMRGNQKLINGDEIDF